MKDRCSTTGNGGKAKYLFEFPRWKKEEKVVRLKELIRRVHLTKEISWLSPDYLWYCVPLTQYLCKVPFERRRQFLFCCCVGIILARRRANFNFRYSFVFQGSVREGVNGKKTFSFGHCPNHLNRPPSPQFGQLGPLFSKVKIQDLKVSLELEILNILYNILYTYIQP